MAKKDEPKRDLEKIDKTIRENFYKLVHSQENVRVTSASSTFKILKAMKKNSQNSNLFNDHLNYTIDRLVSGLASSRALARRGYGTLLLEILKNHQVSTERLFNIAQQKFGHISKEAKLDDLLGYFLLIAIVLESGNHKKSKANTQYLEKIYNHLIHLHNVKSYLGHSVSKILIQYSQIFHPYMVTTIPQHAFGSDVKLTALELLIIILCHKIEPIRELMSIDKSCLLEMFSILLEDKFQKKPLHPIFKEASLLIIDCFPETFETFYSEKVFKVFFKSNHNDLASMGFELIESILESTKKVNPILTALNQHIIRTLIISLRNKSPLQQHCRKFMEFLKAYFESNKDNNELQYAILTRLISPPGSLAFDEDSKSSSLSDLLNKSNADVLKKYLNRLIDILSKTSEIQLQQSCAKQIAFIVARPQLNEETETLLRCARFLLVNSLFTVKGTGVSPTIDALWTKYDLPKPSKNFDDKSLVHLKRAYHPTMDSLISCPNASQKIERLEALISYVSELMDEDSLENEHKVLWSDYTKSLKKYQKLIGKEPNEYNPMTLLFYFYGLQIVEYGLDCRVQLDELKEACKKEDSWADVLTDQLIAILSATECKPCIRKLAESVFGLLVSNISQTSVVLICDAIKTPLNEEGTDGSDEDDEDKNDDDEDSYAESSENDENLSEVAINECDNDTVDMQIDNAHYENKKEEDEESLDEEEEEEEEYLDDDQMMKLDSVIADMFRLNRIGKRKTDPTFQLRCLDLVKKLVAKKHDQTEFMNTILSTIIPLAVKSKKNVETRVIHDKIIKMLKKMPGKSKYPLLAEFLKK